MKTEVEVPADVQAANAYKDSLGELQSISKVEISALTMLAEDNRDYAVQIATCIENQLKTVPKRRKLPILYLIDSICKNNPKSIYVQLFTQNIVSNFCNVFEVSDEKVRKSLYKLRVTWEGTKTFPQKKLNAIDERVHEMDPNWPILHKMSSTSSHQKQDPSKQPIQQPAQPRQQQSHSQQPGIKQQTNTDGGGGVKRPDNNNQSNGRRQKRIRTNNNNRNNNNQPLPAELVMVPPPQPFIDPTIIQAPIDLPQVHPTTYMDPSISITTSDQIHQIPAATFIDPNLIIVANEPQLAAPHLLCTPYQNLPKSQETQPPFVSILDSLYGGKQCSNCSLRFDDNNRYAIHLDWHFRQNAKTSDNMFARRKWYYPLNLWVQFREINDDDLQENNNTDGDVNELLLLNNDYEVPTAPASKDDEKNICSVCHETFEKFYAEEEEEWRLKNAKLYQDERVYHPLCLIDMLQPTVEDETVK